MPARLGVGLLVAAALFLFSGCAGDGVVVGGSPTPGPTPIEGDGPRIDQLEREVLSNNCLFAGCHNAGDAAGDLVLEPGVAYRELVGVASSNLAAGRAGMDRVTPFSPDTSFLLRKLLDPGAGEGGRMPLRRPPLSAAQVELVRTWIEGGALDVAGTPLPTASPTETPEPSTTPTETATPLPSATASITPTGTLEPSATATITPTATATATVAQVSFSTIEQTILRTTCAVSFCHDTQGQSFSGALDLSTSVAYANLVGVSATNEAAVEQSLLRVKPNDPDTSFLLRKICYVAAGAELCPTEPLARAFGSKMPLVGDSLSVDQIAAIRGWIARGAPND